MENTFEAFIYKSEKSYLLFSQFDTAFRKKSLSFILSFTGYYGLHKLVHQISESFQTIQNPMQRAELRIRALKDCTEGLCECFKRINFPKEQVRV